MSNNLDINSSLQLLKPLTKAKLVINFSDQPLTLEGNSFGAIRPVHGEVVFNTGMMGYNEALTDPSYKGQILVLTYPMIGNYGVPDDNSVDENGISKFFESNCIHVAALIVADYSTEFSHWNATKSLGQWLQSKNIPALYGVDTRMLTKLIRESGAVLGRIDFAGSHLDGFVDPNSCNLVAEVSTKEIRSYGAENSPRIIAFDCGMKNNILRYFLYHNKVQVTVVPFDYDLEQNLAGIEYDGIFVSNGPGDPTMCSQTIKSLKWAISQSSSATTKVKPIFGICLGNQLLALATGAKTYKMKYGNRGMNQPCIDLRTTRCYITSQNHGYAVDADSLPADWKPLFLNANDHSNEGIIHTSLPFFSVQFHPEAQGGPFDTTFLFEEFINMVKGNPPERVLLSRSIYERNNIRKVLLIGSGGLSIGQAGEFDYSGSQAIKALKEESIEVVLINPNIATVQTSKNLGRASPDRVYFLPIRASVIEEILKKERPDGVIVSMGGQTALNVGIELWRAGVFEKYQCKVLGTPIEVIIATEDREIFSEKLHAINESLALSYSAVTIKQAVEVAHKIGFPVLVRAAYALGGLGSGFAETEEQLRELAEKAFAVSDQILIDQDLRGWKELEYEVVRDSRDNCITVCALENFDPCGVHTGDSIVVAPTQTLSNSEYFKLRSTSIKVIRSLGIVGECNIQYALDPYSERYCIIEVNARLSRSSALASKATGYPLAYVATKLSLGKDLVSIRNSVNKTTTACFEPSLDYCVIKVPRWDLSKFNKVSTKLGSSMTSVGEVMSIGRTFEEAIQKAVRMVTGGVAIGLEGSLQEGTTIEEMLKTPTDKRLYAIQYALEMGYSIEEIGRLTMIDRWFLSRLRNIAQMKQDARNLGHFDKLSAQALLTLKCNGFSDRQIAHYCDSTELVVRRRRQQMGINPVVKQIDTLAAEFPAQTNYCYMTYNGTEHDNINANLAIAPASGNTTLTAPQKSVMVLGCGAYCIGSSVEFDWCAVSAIRQIRATKEFRAIVVNYNPETVSTDYDESDVLFFEELTLERVLDIYENDAACMGIIVSVGGQIPNNLSLPLHQQGVRILGTSADSIDKAEDRHKFSALLDKMRVDQPAWSELTTFEDARIFAARVGYPVLVRPSFVLSGAAMSVASTETELLSCLRAAEDVSPDKPVVISKFELNAKEIEFDAVVKDGHILNYAISEHVENAGVHSGDATLVLPAQKLYVQTVRAVKHIVSQIAMALKITGPCNFQLLARDNMVKVIECNLRASRTFPFISKTFDANFITLATKVMLGLPTKPYNISLYDFDYVAVKAPMFSFTRLRGADPTLGVEMSSTGEVACFGRDVQEAFLQALLASTFKLPEKRTAFGEGSSVAASAATSGGGKFILISIAENKIRHELEEGVKQLLLLGYQIAATPGTAEYYKQLNYEGFKNIVSLTKPTDEIQRAKDDRRNKVEASQASKKIALPADKAFADRNSAASSLSNTYDDAMMIPYHRPRSGSNLDPTGSPKRVVTLYDKNPPVTSASSVHIELKMDATEDNVNDTSSMSVLNWIKCGKIDLVINIPEGTTRTDEVSSGYLMRRAAVDFGISLLTNIKCAVLFCDALHRNKQLPCKSSDEYCGSSSVTMNQALI